MVISPILLFGSSTLGMFTQASDRFFVLPRATPTKLVRRLQEVFSVPCVKYSVAGSRLVGAFTACNSKGLLLPDHVTSEEVASIEEQLDGLGLGNVDVTTVDVLDNALGNLVLVNDHGCVLSPKLAGHEAEVAEALGVDVRVVEFAGTDLVGSAGLVNNLGGCVHPLATDGEIKLLEDALGVPLDVSSVNCGVPFVGACSAANAHGAVVGPETTGPELQRISEMLQV